MRSRPSLEVADVIRAHGDSFGTLYGPSLSLSQKRALAALARCRTAALGGHVEQCDHCGTRLISYNSCRNRHCPKCQAGRGALWVQREAKSLLPVEYHHLVFTLERRLAGPITLADIEWIWDEYVRYTKCGQTYSDKWRPTQAEGFLQVQEGCFGIRVD